MVLAYDVLNVSRGTKGVNTVLTSILTDSPF